MTGTSEAATDNRSTTPRALGRLALLAGLTSVAVAQPILDLFGQSPATFQVNRIDGTGTLFFAIGVVIIPPVVIWLVTELAGRIDRQAGRAALLVAVAVLGAAFGVLILKELTEGTAIHFVGGVATGAAVAWGVARADAVASLCRYLSVANLAFLAQFALGAPVADWISGEAQPLPEYTVELTDDETSVVMIVLDEWPTQSVLDENENIDPIRFPNLARFAEDATWYRHFSTVSPFTQSAVPALLDGQDPAGDPTWQDHPDTLFTLLAPTHHLTVAESVTQLCGLPGCGVRPVPPPSPNPEEIEPPETELVERDVATGSRWGVVLGDARRLWWDRVTPGSDTGPAAFDDFEEEFVEASPETTPTTVQSDSAQSDAVQPVDPETEELERFLNTLVDTQPSRQQLFLDALQPTDEPFFAFLHLILPHQPWLRREDGSAYDVGESRRDFEADNDDPWSARVGRQRHMLQAEYTDRLIGQLLDRLDTIDAYDDSIIVVVGDHGAAFVPGESSRRVDDENLEQVVYSPLLIKGPGQTEGRIDDSNINSTDLAPTVADLLGTELPWETAGSPAGSDAIAERGSAKYVHNFTDAFTYEFLGIIDYDDDIAWAELLADRYPTIEPGDDRIAALYEGLPGAELIGTAASAAIGPDDPALVGRVEQLGRLAEPGDELPLAEIAGQIDGASPDDMVVVAVNDLVVGVSPFYERGGTPQSFVVLLPADALGSSGNDVRLGLRRADGTVVGVPVTSG